MDNVIVFFICALLIIVICWLIYIVNKKSREIHRLSEDYEKNKLYFNILNIWFSQFQKGKKISDYLKRNNYNKVAVYGMNALGERLISELDQEGIEVACVIDRSPYILGEFNLIKPDDPLPEIDMIIVAAEYYYNEISQKYSDKNIRIVGVSTLIGNAFGMNF